MRAVLLIALALFAGHVARAETFDLGDRHLVVDPPPGTCPLDRNKPGDRSYMTEMQKDIAFDGLLLLAFFRCDDLAIVRRGGKAPMQEQGRVVITLNAGKPRLIGGTGRERALVLARGQQTFEYEKIFRPDGQTTGYLPLSAGKQVSAYRGIVLVDEALYWGSVSKRYIGETPTTLVGILAVALVRQVELSIWHYRPDVTRATLTRLLADQRAYVATLTARNPI